MSRNTSELRYAKSHEWIAKDDDGAYTVGITEHAQELLGDLVFVELPEVGDDVTAGDEVAVVESVKAASDVYSPVTGKIIAVNDKLADAPDLVNKDAFGAGWLFRVELSDESELDDLMEADDYNEHVANEEH